MSTEERAKPPQASWPTWPSPGIPLRPEAWRRGAAGRTLAGSASVVAVAFVVSRVLGLAREVILARQFGTSGEYDAYVAAFRVPDLLFLIIMAGSFGSAFIPVFAGLLARDRVEDAWSLASVVLNLAALAMFASGLVAFVFAGPILQYLVAPGLPPEEQAIATTAMRILLLSPVFLGLGIAAKGILEGQDRFDLPALAPIIYNLAIILGALLLAPRYGVYGVAIGVVAGAVGHVLVQVPGLIRSGMRYRPILDLHVAGVRDGGRLLGPRLVGQAAFQINFIAVTWFASRTEEGAVSALNYAWQLLMLPHGVVALSISTVIFPTMSRLYQQGNIPELRATFGRALRPLLFLTFPCAVGLFFYRTAIVQTLFQSGAFSGASTVLVADPLALFALGLIAYALVEVLTRAFYAMHDTATPVAAGIATIVLNVALSALLVGRYGHSALALSLSLTTAIEGAILLVVLRRRLGRATPSDLGWLARVVAATTVMAVVARIVAPRVTAATEPGVAPRLLQFLLFAYALALTGATYLMATHLLRVPEVQQAVNLMERLPGIGQLGRFGRRPQRPGWR